MATNSGVVAGGILRRTTPEEEMAAFDTLPPPARAALRDAALEWPATSFLAALRKGVPVRLAVKKIRSFEAGQRNVRE